MDLLPCLCNEVSEGREARNRGNVRLYCTLLALLGSSGRETEIFRAQRRLLKRTDPRTFLQGHVEAIKVK